MENQYRNVWETYTSSWKSGGNEEKLELFKKSLHKNCTYTDPLTIAEGWEQLMVYMNDFHRQIPGGYFETTHFLTHHNKSIARWNMKSGDDAVIGDGISYGEYDSDGKLISMVGFYTVPDGNSE